MAERVLVHLGLPKSGTTYLQDIVWSNRETLARQGLLYPGHGRGLHRHASRIGRAQPGPSVRVWQGLLNEIRAWPGTALVSHESLSAVAADQAAQLRADLLPAETHLVVTTRDFGSLLPSVWQQRLKRGASDTLNNFQIPADDHTMWSWRGLDPAEVLQRWAADVPPEQVHVIAPPSAESDLGDIWRRFASVCGVDPDSCRLDLARMHRSLGAPAAELLRRVVDELGPQYATPDISRSWVKRRLADGVLAGLDGPPLPVPAAALPALQERAEHCIKRVRSAGYHVVGDLDQLRPRSGRGTDAATSPDDAEVLAAAVSAVAGLLAAWRAEQVASKPGRRLS